MDIKGKISVMRLGSPLLRRIVLLNILPFFLFSFVLLSMNAFQKYLLAESVLALRDELHIYRGDLTEAIDTIHDDTRLTATERHHRYEEVIKKRLAALSQFSENAHIIAYTDDWRPLVDIRRGIEVNPKGGIWSVPENSFLDSFYGHLLSVIPVNLIGVPYGADRNIIYMENYAFNLTSLKRNLFLNRDHQESPAYIRRISYNRLAISIMEPVRYKGQYVGYLQLTRRAPDIDEGIFLIRSSILTLFFIMVGMSFLFSLYLFWTIARPMRLLVYAFEKMSHNGGGRVDTISQKLLERKDEIGILARVLRENSYALWARLDAIERFASEVSHELKNPLASIRSALETLPFIVDQESRGRLFTIVRDDVCRLQRLIADISEASRLDGDLSRGEREIVDLVPLISLLVEMHHAGRKEEEPYLRLLIGKGKEQSFHVLALEDRLVQVLRNLLSNACSFSPPKSMVTFTLAMKEEKRVEGGQNDSFKETVRMIELCVLDEGPGILETKLENIFDRFYSERPKKEGCDQHSGLGLAMSRQIIEAFGGKIYAENQKEWDEERQKERIKGAKFIIHLPYNGQ